MGCCRGVNVQLLLLVACAMVDYASHTVMLILAPQIALHFYPTTSYARVGFYTALLSGAGFLGHAFSCRPWIQIAKSVRSAQGVILWGLAVLGVGFLSLLFCQSLLAMTLVRFATGLFSGVLPVALIEIDSICGNRQSHLAACSKYIGILFAASMTYSLISLTGKLTPPESVQQDTSTSGSTAHVAFSDASLYFYPLCFVSMFAWVAVVFVVLSMGFQRGPSNYVHLHGEDGDSDTAEEDSITSKTTSVDNEHATKEAPTRPLDRVKTAINDTFRRTLRAAGAKPVIWEPQPHFRAIRAIIPHYLHGYTDDGHVIVWEFLGQIHMDKLANSGFTTVDLRDHYRFLLQFAVERLLKSNSQKIVYVVDLDGLTLMDADDRVVESAISVAQDLLVKFPDKLLKLVILNKPVWFSQVMTRVRPHLPKKTANKITFVSKKNMSSELLELIGADSLPRGYGGSNGVEMGKSSQERMLDELLRETTGSLEETVELVSTRHRAGSLSRGTDDESDEEAFFDSLEFGLPDDEEEEDISGKVTSPVEETAVIHSQTATETSPVSRKKCLSKTSPKRGRKAPAPSRNGYQHVINVDPLVADLESAHDIAITSEPHACLILGVYFLWALLQMCFDEILPLWFFKRSTVVESAPLPLASLPHSDSPSVSAITLTVAESMALMALGVLVAQLCSCAFSSSVMTPLATLRLGLLIQIPIIGCFPLIKLLHADELSFAWAIVLVVLIIKNMAEGISLHGLLALLDNSIPVDRRIAVNRAVQLVSYVAQFVAGSGGPLVFALLGYFDREFPLDQSLLYFLQALGLILLFLFSFLIPSRLNFPMLFAMGKR